MFYQNKSKTLIWYLTPLQTTWISQLKSKNKNRRKKKIKKENDHRNKINIKLLLSFQLKYDVITQLNTKFSTLIFTPQLLMFFLPLTNVITSSRREESKTEKLLLFSDFISMLKDVFYMLFNVKYHPSPLFYI